MVASGAGKDSVVSGIEKGLKLKGGRWTVFLGIIIWLGQKRLCVFIRVVGCEGEHGAGLGLMQGCALTPVSQVPACAN